MPASKAKIGSEEWKRTLKSMPKSSLKVMAQNYSNDLSKDELIILIENNYKT